MESKVRRSSKAPKLALPEDLPGDYLKCFSCGRCVGDCPASLHSSFNIRVIIQDMIADYEGLLKGDMIWKCFQCDLCSLVCPVNLIPADLIRQLRQVALQQGYNADRLKTFTEFYQNVKATGLIILPSESINRARRQASLETPPLLVDPTSRGFELIKDLPWPVTLISPGNPQRKNVPRHKTDQKKKKDTKGSKHDKH